MKERQLAGDVGFRYMRRDFGSISKAAVMHRTRFVGGCDNSRHWIVGYATIVWQPAI